MPNIIINTVKLVFLLCQKYKKEIMKTPNGAIAKKIANEKMSKNNKRQPKRKEWDAKKEEIMGKMRDSKSVSSPKFTQRLLDSGDIFLVHSTKYEKEFFWSSGANAQKSSDPNFFVPW